MNDSDQNSKIITVTLAPSLDRTLLVHYLHNGYQNVTSGPTRLDPAGFGLNISRAVHKLEVDTHAIILLGNDPTGQAYQQMISDEKFSMSIISVDGQTLSTMVIYDTGNEQETKIIEEAKEISQQDVALVVETLKEIVNPGDSVVLAGALPSSLSEDVYAWLTEEAHKLDARVVLAASGNPLQLALKARPDIVFIRKIELEPLFNYPVRDDETIITSGKKLIEQGASQIYIGMPEDDRALYLAKDKVTQVTLQEYGLGTTSGVWEAMIAGFLVGKHHHESLSNVLELSSAAALYTASKVGHEFGEQKDIEDFKEEVEIEEQSDSPSED